MGILDHSWMVLGELAPWLLLGALVSGLLHGLLPAGFVRRQLQGRFGVADALGADLLERGVAAAVRSVRAADTYIPLGPSTRAVLVTEEQIVEGALALARAGAKG